MAVIETWLRQDLKGLVTVRSLQGQVFSLDNGGNLIGVKVTKDGQPVTLTGTVTGYCILSDGQTVTVTGSGKSGIQNGNEAYIVLPQLVYSVPGQISIVIKLTSGSVTTTLAACTGYVYRSRTSNEVVPPGTPIPDLATLEEVIRRATEATTRATEAATDAEKVDASMTKEGDVITISVTDRNGNVTQKTVTDQSEAMKHKADIDGYYEELAAGTADQLVSTEAVTDTTPYLYRKSGGSVDIGNRETLEKIVGGTVAWNQIAETSDYSYSANGITITRTANTGTTTIVVSDSATGYGQIWLTGLRTTAGHKYLLYSDKEIPNGMEIYSTPIRIIGNQPAPRNKQALGAATSANPFFLYVGQNTTPGTYNLHINAFDLTTMFGPTIADYIYNLEQAKEGDGVIWFHKLFPKDYYSYNPGELISVKTTSHDMVGFNLWDGTGTDGKYVKYDTGELINWTGGVFRATDYIKVLPNTAYYFNQHGVGSAVVGLAWYDENKNYISGLVFDFAGIVGEKTSPSNACYVRTSVQLSEKKSVCINLSGSRNGEYDPYEKHSYPLADVELRGPLAIDADGKLVYSGDEYTPDGNVKRKYGIVDLGTLNWVLDTTTRPADGATIHAAYAALPTAKKTDPANEVGNMFLAGYETTTVSSVDRAGLTVVKDKLVGGADMNGRIWLYNSAYNDLTREQVKAALSGSILLFELATPETEQVAPYTPIQVVDDWGTEEFVDNREVAIPVGHSTSYMANLRDKLQHLPSLAEEDGEYIVKQTGSQMSLAPFKSGTYPDMHVGVADQLLSKQSVEDQVPYGLRQSGGGLAIGDREEDMIVGGTVGWNQLLQGSAIATKTQNGLTWSFDSDKQELTIDGTSTARTIIMDFIFTENPIIKDHIYYGVSKGLTMHSDRSGWSITFSESKQEDIRRATANVEGSARIETINAGLTFSNTKIKFQLFDLTAMFGPTIADYIYNLEQTTAGAGVAWFKKLFPKDYYEYNAGELKSVEAVNAHEMVRFNQWDEEWELGYIDPTTGVETSASDKIRMKNFMRVLPSTTYYKKSPYPFWCVYFDENKKYVGYTDGNTNRTFTTPSNARYMRSGFELSYGTTYKNDTCINFSDPSRNGEYEPYHKSSYPLDSSLTLRGIPKLDANNKLYYDGDTYAGDGTVTRRYGIVDLGTLTWSYTDNVGDGEPGFYTGNPGIPVNMYNSDIAPLMCDRYTTVAFYTSTGGYFDGAARVIAFAYQAGQRLYVRDSTYYDVASFKAAMSGVMLVYKLATPTTEQAEPYQSVQQVDPYGTEKYTHSGEADVYVPVGHVTKYPSDLRSKIENAPDSPSGNGDYIVRKTADGVSYVPLTQAKEIPAPPSANGTYRLTVTVTNGTPTYSWVSA